jgi:two-component system phosphate regulon sensor histidine kinase PhoR
MPSTHPAPARADAQWDSVLRQLPEGILLLDSDGRVTRVNLVVARLTGCPEERIVGRPLLATILSYPLDQEVRKVLAGGPGGTVEIRLSSGKSIRAAIAPIEGEWSDDRGDGPAPSAGGAAVYLQDITLFRQIDAVRRDFVANVSHELRTPVSAIRSFAETLMLRAEKRPELIQQYGSRIVVECERLDTLVRDLLLLAEAESRARPLNIRRLPCAEIISSVISQFEPLVAGSSAALVAEAERGLTVPADGFCLERCLANLAENAIRHAPGSDVRIGCGRKGEEIRFWVSDNGPGIPEEDVGRVFERFFRVDRARGREGGGGSGLGLSIVRHLAELQGGRAWAESRPGEGATFYLAFPAIPTLDVADGN